MNSFSLLSLHLCHLFLPRIFEPCTLLEAQQTFREHLIDMFQSLHAVIVGLTRDQAQRSNALSK